MKVAYLLASFPNTSETFILNEIVEALERGVDIRVFSTMQPAVSCPHSKVRLVENRIEYLQPVEDMSLFGLLFSHARFLVRHPYRYLRTLSFALKRRRYATLWAFKVCMPFAHAIGRFGPDLIHTHFARGTTRFAMLISRLLGIDFTFTVHGWHDLYKQPPEDLQEMILSSKQTITVCEYNRDHLLKTYEVPDTRVCVVRCGITMKDFLPPESGSRQPGLIVSVGRLHYHKAYHNLVSACELLRTRGMPFRCLIVGDGELRGELKKQIAALGLGGIVELLGEKSNEEVRNILCSAQVFVLPSIVEVLGMANVEAMATGLPVVATGVFGVPELVENGVTGLLCEPDNPSELADRLQTLLSDPDRCLSMGRRGREKVLQEYDIAKQVKKLEKIWSQRLPARPANDVVNGNASPICRK
jgi:glycosyltransferase involved in cell wall biosynthesis